VNRATLGELGREKSGDGRREKTDLPIQVKKSSGDLIFCAAGAVSIVDKHPWGYHEGEGVGGGYRCERK
jgi:hypothetical protein